MPSLDRQTNYGKAPARNGGHPKKRGIGPAAVRDAFDLESDDSAQKHIDRAFRGAIREAQVLVLKGATAPIVAHVAHLNAMLETGPARPLTAGLLHEGHVSRSLEESREACIAGGATPDEVDLHEARVRRVIEEGFAALRDIHAHRAAR